MTRPTRCWLFLLFVLAGSPLSGGIELSLPIGDEEISITDGLVVGPLGRYRRSAVYSDPLEYRRITGALEQPRPGLYAASTPDGKELAWEKITLGEQGWFRSPALRGGYLHCTVKSDRERVMVLEASGHSWVLVNGAPRGGDVYGYGWIQHPVRLQAGENNILFRVSRGKVRAKLVEPGGPVFLSDRDMTLPHLILGEDETYWGAVRVINATERGLEDVLIRCEVEGGAPTETVVWSVSPMTSRKVGFRISGPEMNEEGNGEGNKEGKVKARLILTRAAGDLREELSAVEIELKVRSPHSHHNRTFLSEIDGSVQYYSLSPGQAEGDGPPALFLTCHGASVEAEGQARCYRAKSWGHVVAPTNRRPYGFDWEDWGRLDAMEVLRIAEAQFGTDPSRTYLTGHSMGGHGAWYLGATYPDRFAAIGPSAGWYSFWSYGGKEADPSASTAEALFARASHPSDTLALSRNYLHHGVYVLHGDRDDNVPVDQARFMRKHLAEFHTDFAYYERPGAGHWWGNACCDWDPLFQFFKSHEIPDHRKATTVEFYTANPGISSSSRWAEIVQQRRFLDISSIRITQDVEKRTFKGSTENVALLSLDLAQLDPGETVTVELDGSMLADLPAPQDPMRLYLARSDDGWRPAQAPGPEQKGPHRAGTFKDAFRHRVIFVYATEGNEAENAWAYQKARYDAESFWYRGNASVDVVTDRDFNPAAEPDRSVILYGNRESNGAWELLLKNSPIQVMRGKIVVDGRELAGDDLGCCFIRPRPNSERASVGVVAGSGVPGMLAATANMYFIAGSGYPDVLVFGADMLRDHFEGVRLVGYFGNDWSIEKGAFAWRDE